MDTNLFVPVLLGIVIGYIIGYFIVGPIVLGVL